MSKELILHKMVQVLDKLLARGAHISDTNVTRLVKCVTGMQEDLIDVSRLNRILKLWLSKAVNIWENDLPHPAVLTLALNFSVFLSSEEQYFIELMTSNVIEKFIKILKITLQTMGATPDIGYVKLMSCFLKHSAGSAWMLTTNYWSEILCLTVNSDQNLELYREKNTFICDLLSKSLDINMEFPSKIIYSLLLPTIDFSEIVNKSNNIDESLFNSNCLPKLDLLENIIESYLDKKEEKMFRMFKIILEISEKFAFEDHATDICIGCSNDDIFLKLFKIVFMLRHLEIIYDKKDTPLIVYADFLPYIEKAKVIRKKLRTQYQKFFPKIVFNWVKLHNKSRLLLPKIRLTYGTIVNIEDTVICFQLIPIFSISHYFYRESYNNFENNELREKYFLERIRAIPPVAYDQLYQIRNYMEEKFSFEYSLTGIEYILQSVPYYSRNQANNILICLIYCLDDFNGIMAKNKDIVTTENAMEYLGLLIEVVRAIITKFNLKWPDTFEIISLMEMVLSTISTSGVCSQVIVNGLELISVAFSQHLSVGLTFLMDHLDGDLIEKIILYCTEKMDEEKNQVRCSAVKVIESISNIVNENFSSFQSLILKNNLPVKIFEFVTKDNDPNVRASAVKCLQEMAKVDQFWNAITKKYNIYEYICQLIYEDFHDIVRSEVTTLIAIIYDQHEITNDIFIKFCDTISYSLSEDTNSIVRKNSLSFWKNVIQRHLTIEGMIDGEFPEITFSKESRKMVILNDQEVKKRLIKILQKLSENGCLSALKTALEDCDVEIIKDVKEVVTDFWNLVKRYSVQSTDFEFNISTDFEDPFSILSEFFETDISGVVKGRQILNPKLFLDYVEQYFKESTSETSQNLIETTLNEILHGNSCESYIFIGNNIPEV